MYKILSFCITAFGFPREKSYYNLKEDGLFYEIGDDVCGLKFDSDYHKIYKLQYNNKIYEVGKDDIVFIGFKRKVLSCEIVNFFQKTIYSESKYLLIENKNKLYSIWVNVL